MGSDGRSAVFTVLPSRTKRKKRKGRERREEGKGE